MTDGWGDEVPTLYFEFDHGRPTGVLTRADLLEYLANHRNG